MISKFLFDPKLDNEPVDGLEAFRIEMTELLDKEGFRDVSASFVANLDPETLNAFNEGFFGKLYYSDERKVYAVLGGLDDKTRGSDHSLRMINYHNLVDQELGKLGKRVIIVESYTSGTLPKEIKPVQDSLNRKPKNICTIGQVRELEGLGGRLLLWFANAAGVGIPRDMQDQYFTGRDLNELEKFFVGFSLGLGVKMISAKKSIEDIKQYVSSVKGKEL